MRLSKLFLKSFVLKIFASILYTLVNFNINTLQCSYLVPLLSLAVVLVSPAGQRQRASLPGRSPFALLPVYLWFVRPTSFTRVVPTTLNMLQVFCDQNGLHAHTRWFFSCGFGSCDQIWPHLQSHMITLTPPTLAIFASRASCTASCGATSRTVFIFMSGKVRNKDSWRIFCCIKNWPFKIQWDFYNDA